MVVLFKSLKQFYKQLFIFFFYANLIEAKTR